jgi:hypothetical protein
MWARGARFHGQLKVGETIRMLQQKGHECPTDGVSTRRAWRPNDEAHQGGWYTWFHRSTVDVNASRVGKQCVDKNIRIFVVLRIWSWPAAVWTRVAPRRQVGFTTGKASPEADTTQYCKYCTVQVSTIPSWVLIRSPPFAHLCRIWRPVTVQYMPYTVQRLQYTKLYY